MHPKSPKWLDDIAVSCAFVLNETASRSLPDYERDRRFRSAIERSIGIAGTALLHLEQADRATVECISNYRTIIDMRQRLLHHYDDIDNQQVWEIIQQFVPVLKSEVEQLLREAEDE